MLGFSKENGVKITGKFAEEMFATLVRHRNGEYTEEEIEGFHEEHVTPEVLIKADGDTLDPLCRYCDEHRNKTCNGREPLSPDCVKFKNKFDAETCEKCKFAESIEDDERHVFCPQKNEKRYILRWCKQFEKK